MTATTHDVIVVGGGPAGSATASLLAAEGLDVALIDRAHFPRPKPCAEYLSPEAGRVLARLGVLEELRRAQPAELRGMRIVAPSGVSFTGRFDALAAYPRFSDTGLALRREVLDVALLRAAQARGVRVLEGITAEGLDVTAERATVHARSVSGPVSLSGRLVVGADGLHSRISRLLGLTRQGHRRRVAFVAHATGVAGMADVGEMHVGTAGYVGLAPVGHGVTNVAAVVDAARLELSGGAAERMHQLLDAFPAVRERLAAAEWVSPVRAVGPFARWTRRATSPRVALVGDAADFYDPFTGEGIYAALHGAELLAARAAPALADQRHPLPHLAAYDRDRRRAFGGKWIIERLIGWTVARPRVFNHAARRLSARPDLAHLLVGVTGDFIPPRRVLRPSYLWRLAW